MTKCFQCTAKTGSKSVYAQYSLPVRTALHCPALLCTHLARRRRQCILAGYTGYKRILYNESRGHIYKVNSTHSKLKLNCRFNLKRLSPSVHKYSQWNLTQIQYDYFQSKPGSSGHRSSRRGRRAHGGRSVPRLPAAPLLAS